MIPYSSLYYLRITRRQFITSIIIAFILHSIFIGALRFMPQKTVEEIPVKTLRIKLGTGLTGEEELMLEQANLPAENSDQVEQSLESALTDTPMDNHVSESALVIAAKPDQKKAADKPEKPKLLPKQAETQPEQVVAKQYVRKRIAQQPAPQATGDTLGNVEVSSQLKVKAYMQTISVWLDKFKVYPEAARAAGMEGRARLRIRIDRRGNIRYSILSERTAYPIIDQAVLDMARRANPVPPVPDDYPDKNEYLEFVISITFKDTETSKP